MRIAFIYNSEVREIYTEFETLEEAKASFPSDMVLMEIPDGVDSGWTYDGENWNKPVQIGFEYDIKDMRFYAHEEYREILHERTSNDTLQAIRKLREGDQSYDWQSWLDKLDAYNKAIEDTQLQETYPEKVIYPEYPTR